MRFRSLGLMVLAPVLATCATEPVVTTVTLNTADVSLDAIGATAQLSADLLDQDGKPIQADLSWSSSNEGVATVSASGLVTAQGNGTAQVTASAGNGSDAVNVTVQQAVSTLVKAGDAQTGTAGEELPMAVEVDVQDRLGEPIAGATVDFTVTAGGGSITPTVTSGTDGRAAATWVIGRVAGAAQAAQATASTTSATFSATAIAGPPDSLVKVSGDNQVGAPGAQLASPLVVRVADRFGNPIQGHTVNWAVTSGAGSVNPTASATAANGQTSTQWTLGNNLGAQTAEATAAGVSTGSPAVFNANATAGTMAIHDGNNQTGLVGFAPNFQPSVIVRDGSNNPLVGVTVTFSVASGGGSVSGAVQTTNTQGIAQVGKWTLGSTPGTNTLTATASGAIGGSPQTFTATGAAAGYDVEVRMLTSVTPTQQAAFDAAEARWETLVYGNLPSETVNLSANQCGTTHPAVNETVDDIVIFVRLESIDGPGGVLGSAGPCWIRSSFLPALGIMRFDTDDLDNLEASNQLGDVILHEMAHALGYGTLWGSSHFDQRRNPSCNGSTPIDGQDTYLEAARARAAFDTLGGTSYTGGEKVPLENSQGSCPGTRDGHWRESVFEHELMTGFIEAPGMANPLSVMSVASLWDMNYTVNYDAADAYTQAFTAPPAAAAAVGRKLELVNDVWLGPLFIVDSAGKVTRDQRR